MMGFKTICYGYNLFLTGPKDAFLLKGELKKKLEATLKNHDLSKWRRAQIRLINNCLDSGAAYLIKKPNSKSILTNLHQGVPMVASVVPAALVNKQGDPKESHLIVLSGEDGEKVSYINPADGLEKQTDIENLLFAINSRPAIDLSAYLVAISK